MAELRTPDEWCDLLGVIVHDPDGWRGRDGRPWEDPISRDEFERRLWVSTIELWVSTIERRTVETGGAS